jgi:hypothetical protein
MPDIKQDDNEYNRRHARDDKDQADHRETTKSNLNKDFA